VSFQVKRKAKFKRRLKSYQMFGWPQKMATGIKLTKVVGRDCFSKIQKSG
jgi:hypothetical protein